MKVALRNYRPKHGRLIFEATNNVVRLEANINYTLFVLSSGRNRMMSYTLGMSGLLLCDSFLRVNRSCIINKNYIKFFDKANKQLLLSDGTTIGISRRRWEEVNKYLG